MLLHSSSLLHIPSHVILLSISTHNIFHDCMFPPMVYISCVLICLICDESTCDISSLSLIRYNKYLLGEDFGKFPAPLLMNTIHFSMQAIMSSLVVRFSWCGVNPSQIRMTWKDYFVRGTDSFFFSLHPRFQIPQTLNPKPSGLPMSVIF